MWYQKEKALNFQWVKDDYQIQIKCIKLFWNKKQPVSRIFYSIFKIRYYIAFQVNINFLFCGIYYRKQYFPHADRGFHV